MSDFVWEVEAREVQLREEESALYSAEKKGREEGREEGREQGRKEGEEKGREEERTEIIEKLKKRGMSEEEIKEILLGS
ncbi:MAG: hypothetical protein FWH05_02585 [Oscillospiraceae bacterium]|nr:hypothetical protein [Oscillospiraceae bacterium]